MGTSHRAEPFSAILAGTDGSERAEQAVRLAARFASGTGATMELVFVIDSGRAEDADVEDRAEAALGRAATIASTLGVDAPRRVLAGDPADVLVQEAADHGMDLLCVGPDAGVLHGAIRIGRVAAHVLRHADCSVLVGRESGPEFPARILCAVDGSAGSDRAVRIAVGIAASAGAGLRFLHVIPGSSGDERPWTLDPDEPSPSELESAVDAADAAGITPIRELALGRAEYAILGAAEHEGSDLLVVGHRGVTGLSRTLLGSVSEYVAAHARCSVLVTRSAADST
jgi:nucleotide-binding universal stress UspA family protein